MRALIFTYSIVAIVILSSCGDQPIENREFFTINNVGANGYDLVSYFSADAPIEGLAAHEVQINKVTYYFANQENKLLFEATPEKYLPAYGGWCAYAMANDGSLMPSNPDKYEIQDGKLYLFFDNFLTSIQGGLQKEWNADPAKFQTQADENWDEHIKTIY